MLKILITDPIHQSAIESLRKNFIVEEKFHLSEQELLTSVNDCNAIICRTSTKLTTDVINAAHNLKCIGVHATGWDHIDIETATNKGIVLLGYPTNNETIQADRLNGSFIPVAEYVLMGMLTTSKKLIEANDSMKHERWDKYSLSGSELFGKTLGIIGIGRIGSLVAERAKSFGMNVIAHHPRLTSNQIIERGAESVTLDEIYAKSDFVSVHIPKTKENVGLINSEAFAKMKKNPVLINTSRAAIINESHLIDALNSGTIRAAVLDVFENAPNAVNWSLVKHPHVIATPHIAGVTNESLLRVSSYIAEVVTDYLKYGKIKGQIGIKA